MEAKAHGATKTLTTNWNSSNLGFTLLEAMVTIGIMSIAAMGVMGVNVTAMKANKSASLRSDIIDVKRMITNRISCEKTIPTKPATCVPGKVIRLKDAKGEFLAPSGKIGEWTIEASCESLGTPAAPGLSIYATKNIPGSSEYAKDPLRNINFDRSHPSSSLFKPEVRLCSERFSSTPPEGGPVPAGGIVMWSGDPGSIPVGWALCDGSNGTPDLSGRFIVGSGGGYSPGMVGGRDAVALSERQLPKHSHGASASASASASTYFDGLPAYVNTFVDVGRGEEEAVMPGCESGCGGGWRSVAIRQAKVNVSVSVGVGVAEAGGSEAFDIRPPYYSLAFIMRLD